MTISDKIKQIFRQDKHKKLVFYFDTDGTFEEELEEIEANGIKVIRVGQNYFHLKYQLEMEMQGEEIFLYHSFPKPNYQEIKKYPLLDLLTANHELRLDEASEFMEEYNLQEIHLPLIKRYIKQLKTKTNKKKLASILDENHFNEDNLKQGLISIILDFSSVVDQNNCIAKLFFLATDSKAFDKVVRKLIELELDKEFLSWLESLLGDKYDELTRETITESAKKLKYNIITAYIEKIEKTDTYSQLKLENTSKINRLLSFFQDWRKQTNLKEQIPYVFDELAIDIQTKKIMEWYGKEQDFGYYSEDMRTDLLTDFYSQVDINPGKTKDICFKWLDKSSLSEGQNEQVRFLYHTAGVYSVLSHYSSFNFNTPEEYINEYANELYKIDEQYRKAIISFDKVRDRLYEFDEKASKVFKKLNEKYDRFLIDLNVAWQQLLNDNQFDFHKIKTDKQFDFYNKNIKGFDYKIAVIISDAFRYELGQELYDQLMKEDHKNDLSIKPCLASIPSYTNLGMTNLLPHSEIEVEKDEADLSFKINGKKTISTYREAILQITEKESSTIDYSVLRKMSKEEKRAFFKKSRITYIYHDWIDAIGDKKRTEHQVFVASAQAIEDLKWIVRNITGEIGISHVFITSDHGFLFNYNDLPESSREKLPKAKGYARDHSRFVIADEFEGKVDGYQLDLCNTTNINTDLQIAIPRAINRYKKQGNIGVQFVHGGASLQELITPVIRLYKNKKDNSQYVTFKRTDGIDKIGSGNLKLVLVQEQPVSNSHKSIEVIFGIYSDTGILLSDEVELNLNSISNSPRERIFEAILSLNSQGSKASFGYIRAFDKKDKARLNPIINDLVKITSLMEKDEF